MDTTIVFNGEDLDVTINWHIESEVNDNGFTVWHIADIWVTHVNGVKVDSVERKQYYEAVNTAEMDDTIRTWLS